MLEFRPYQMGINSWINNYHGANRRNYWFYFLVANSLLYPR